MRIIGVDPGTRKMGVGVIEKSGSNEKCVFYETLSAPARLSLPERLHRLHRDLEAVVEEYAPEEMAVEGVFFCKDFKAE